MFASSDTEQQGMLREPAWFYCTCVNIQRVFILWSNSWILVLSACWFPSCMITSYESDSGMWVMSNLAANRSHLRVVASCNLQLRGWCHISDSSLLVCLVEATSVAYQTAGSIEDVVIDLSQQEILDQAVRTPHYVPLMSFWTLLNSVNTIFSTLVLSTLRSGPARNSIQKVGAFPFARQRVE